jgi:hypothetical protein
VYFPSLMLMALHEERVRDFDRRASRANLRSLKPGQARSGQARSWRARASAAMSGRSHAAAARRAELAPARGHS